MKKLNNDTSEPGVVRYADKRGGHSTYKYYLNDILVFRIGITRSSKAKSKKFRYVPDDMRLTNAEYRKLDGCKTSKKEYNEKIRQRGELKR